MQGNAMAIDLKNLAGELFTAIEDRANKTKKASLVVKVGLIAIGSAFVAIAQFAQFGEDGPTGWQIAGILAAVVVAIGAVFVVLTEDDAPKEMNIAQRAVEAARQIEEEYSEFTESQLQLEMAINIYTAIKLMREVIERTVVQGTRSDDIVRLMFEVADRNIPISVGFEQADQWTICAYRALPIANGRMELKCIAHDRAVKCSIDEARTWEEGIGVAGICYSNAVEIIVPDMQAADIGSVFNIGGRSRNYDASRYRSIIAVPISIGQQERPWGVVTATSDRPFHFSPEDAPGIKTSEGVRSLAGMIALAIAVAPTQKSAFETSQ
jgi:GAF domain-containing protein